MVPVAGIVCGHLENLLTYLTHRITNAVTEGLNAKIPWIKYSSRGFRDRERFQLAIQFHCGGLLDPRPTTSREGSHKASTYTKPRRPERSNVIERARACSSTVAAFV